MDVLGGVGADPTVDVSKAVEATDGGQPAIDSGGSQASLFHHRAIELDMGLLRFQDGEAHVDGPPEECPKVVAIGVKSATVVPGEKRCGRHLRLVEAGVGDDGGQVVRI